MWYYEVDYDGIVISSRVRFARNFKEYKFPNMMNKEDANKLINSMENVLNDKAKLIKLSAVDNITLNSLVERHLVSKEFLSDKDKRALLLSDDCTLSIMINEEDHLRIQGFASGNNIQKAYQIAKNAEKQIGEKQEYAMHEKFGYLTSCPTNVGSGLRVSVMLHLPALTKLGYISRLLQDAAAFGIAIRGIYGENTAAEGHIYQISNQRTMGYTDEEIIASVEKIVKNIVNQEKKARTILMEDKTYFEDKVMRALGVLKYARRMDTEEAEKHLSIVRMGVSLGIVQDIDKNLIQKISVNVHPNMLKLELKKSMEEGQRDIERSNYIRKELK